MPTPEAQADRKAAKTFLRLMILQTLVIVALFGLVIWSTYAGRVALHDSQLRGCERGKLDRRANADGWGAHAAYIGNVTQADSVKEDVKIAARTAQGTYERIAADLMERSNIDCLEAFPEPGIWP